MPMCSAFGCSNRSENGFQMFYFPSEKHHKDRKAKWEQAVRRMTDGKPWKSTRGSCLCIEHFECDAFEKIRVDGKRKLRRDAVPTKFSHVSVQKNRKPPMRRGAIEAGAPAAKVQCDYSYFSKSYETEESVCSEIANPTEPYLREEPNLSATQLQEENKAFKTEVFNLKTQLRNLLEENTQQNLVITKLVQRLTIFDNSFNTWWKSLDGG